MTRLDEGPQLVLHAVPEDVEAAANLDFVAAHLAEFPRARTDRSAAAALVVGDPDRCSELMAAGVPTVYLCPAGAAPGDPGTADVSASIVCRQGPSWLAQSYTPAQDVGRSETRVAAVAPPKRIRSAGGGGPAIQLTGGCPEPERTVEILRSALHEAGPATGPIPVLTDLAAEDWAQLARPLREFTFTQVDFADWPRVLRRADVLVAAPTVLAATFAQATHLPLRLLPAAGTRQSRIREALAALAGGAGGSEAVTVTPDAWPTAEDRAGTLGGAAQIARQIRQLCLAPV